MYFLLHFPPTKNKSIQQETITTIDTKSSPLALLAQTCSAIGADTTNPKLLAANIEKATKAHKSSSSSSLDNRDKSSPLSSHSSVSTGSAEQQLQQHQPTQQQHQQPPPHQPQPVKCSFKPYETNNNHIRERIDVDAEQATNLTQAHSQLQQHQQQHQRVKTPKMSNNGSSNGLQTRCDSNQSASSQRGESPAINGGGGAGGGGGTLRRTPSSVNSLQQDMQQQHQRALSSPAAHHQQQHKTKELNLNGGGSLESSQHMSTATSRTSPSQQSSAAAAASSARLQASNEAAALAQASKEANYMKALQAAAAASGGSAAAGSAASAYYTGYPSSMSYPMDLMTASALMSPHHPMFKAASLNPYLNYARLKGLEMQPNICRDPYCTGCPSSPHFLNKAAGQPCPAGCPQCEREVKGGSSAAAAAASSYHAQLAALAAASQMPYVCSWIGGDTPYCGKRFATSDELFQHLRTHTASLPESVLTAAAQGGIPPNHPLFQRTYPTPPLSPLSAARYHPYGKPSMLPPSLAAAAAAAPPGSLASLQMQQHPALAQYFSPYSLYGPRMGSSHP
ncbi:zinc finger protein elbow B isoform X2 [Musca autumnalis]|uniref:zinc finger protein elbow B isoform X2 n=1 Tax=Musca autumnalis TaxID=221902 RepID=UPI003CE8B5AB